MNERYDPDILLAYIEGELAPAEADALERELADDARLRRLVEQLREDRDALRQLPAEAPPRDLLADATQQLERDMLLGPTPERAPAPAGEREGVVHRVHWGRTLTYGALAAMVALSAGVILVAVTDMTLLREAAQYARMQDPAAQEQQVDADRPPAEMDVEDEGPVIVAEPPVGAAPPEPDAPVAAPEPDALGALADAAATTQADDTAVVGERTIVAQLDPATPRALRAPREPAEPPLVAEAPADPPTPGPLAAARRAQPTPQAESKLEAQPEVALGSEPDLDVDAESFEAAPQQDTTTARVPGAVDPAPDGPPRPDDSAEQRVARRAVEAVKPSPPREAEPPRPVRVDIATRSVAQTQRELIEWVQAHDASMTLDGRAFTLRVRADHLGDLMAHLNREPGEQRAALAVGSAPVAVALGRPESSEPTPAPVRARRQVGAAPDEPAEESVEEPFEALEAMEPVEVELGGESTVIQREAAQREVSVTLGQLWSQRERLLQAFTDALATQQLQRRVAAEQPEAEIDALWSPALNWRQRLAERLTPDPPTPTIELAVVIEEVSPSE